MTAALVLLGAMANLGLGLILMGHNDDGRVMRWCERHAPPGLLYPTLWLAASLWPVGLWFICRRR